MKTLEELKERYLFACVDINEQLLTCDELIAALESEIERLKAKRKTDIAAAFVAGRSKKRWIDWLAEYEKNKER